MKQVLAKSSGRNGFNQCRVRSCHGGSRCWSCFRSAGDGPSSRSQMKGETVEERTAIAKSDEYLQSLLLQKFKERWTIVERGRPLIIVLIFQQQRLRPCWWWHQDDLKHEIVRSLLNLVSADVLEARGLTLDLGPEDLGRVFEKAGIVFLFC